MIVYVHLKLLSNFLKFESAWFEEYDTPKMVLFAMSI